jgi:hypothetical protein
MDAGLAEQPGQGQGLEDGFYSLASHEEGAKALAAIKELRDSGAERPPVPSIAVPDPHDAVPAHLIERVNARLRPGETIMWSAQPNAWRYARGGYSVPLAMLGLILIGTFASVGFMGAARELAAHPNSTGLPDELMLPGLTLLAGLLMMGVSAYRWCDARNRVFVVTNERAAEFHIDVRGVSVSSWHPKTMHFPRIESVQPPFGSVWFSSDDLVSDFGFEGIADPREAARAIIRLHNSVVGPDAPWEAWPERSLSHH